MTQYEKAQEFLASFPLSNNLTRPVVTLTYAQSIDGKIGKRQGPPVKLSGEASLCMTHRLRQIHEAILVGVDTIINDNPRLTGNPSLAYEMGMGWENTLRIPPTAVLFSLSRPIIFVAPETVVGEEWSLLADVIPVVRADGGGLCLKSVLGELNKAGLNSVMVEGGARVISSFIKAGLVDQAIITLAPKFLGPDYLAGIETEAEFKLQRFEQFDEDLVIWGTIK